MGVPTVDMPRLLVCAGPCMLPEGPTLHDLGPASLAMPMAGLQAQKSRAKAKLQLMKPNSGEEAAANAQHASMQKPNRPLERISTQPSKGADCNRKMIARGLTVSLGTKTGDKAATPRPMRSQGLKRQSMLSTMPASIGLNT